MSDKTNKTHSGFAYDGGINGGSVIRPLSEGYTRRGGQVQAPATAAPRPAPPPPFRPAPPPAAAPTTNGPQKDE